MPQTASSAEIDQLVALYNAGRFAELENRARLLVEQFPNLGPGWKLLGGALKMQGKNALPAFKRAAELLPDDADAHFDLGVAQKNFGLLNDAASSYLRAIQIKSDHAEAYFNLGNLLIELGQVDKAVASYRRALQIRPDYADAYSSLGNVQKDLGKTEEAVASHRRAVALQPGDPRAHYNLGNALAALGQPDEAVANYRLALQVKPDFAEAHNQLGIALIQLGQLDDALASYRRALELKPEFADAHNNLGMLFKQLGQYDTAAASYRRAVELKPDFAEAHGNLGDALQELGQHDDARTSHRRALQLNYVFAENQNKFGTALQERGQLEGALAHFRRAVQLKPDYARAHNNLGAVLMQLKQFDNAEASLQHALQLNPDSAWINLNLAYLFLALGQYAKAWPKYEARYDPSIAGRLSIPPDLPFPQWQGESLAGKSILIWPEQGMGDEIQFARYVPLLKERGASRITLVCKPPLKALLETLDGVDVVVARSEAASLPHHDYWVFPMSLPLYFSTTIGTIPATLPYLKVPLERLNLWRNRLPAASPKVGLVWKGNAAHKNDANRSLPNLAALAALWSVPGVTFVSLQKGNGEDEAAMPPANQPIIHLGSEISDFADTAAIVAQLDLVICVDTAIAHLAGALNKPCWVLLPAIATDWRWLPEQADSLWYPGVVRLFRQKKKDDWPATIGDVTQALKNWVDARGNTA